MLICEVARGSILMLRMSNLLRPVQSLILGEINKGQFVATHLLPSYTRHLSTSSQCPIHHNISALLKEMNTNSLKLHKEVGESLSKLLQYAIIYQGGSLSLWQPVKDGWKHVERIDITNDKYHNYKSLAHIPFNIKLILEKNDLEKASELLSHLHQLKLLCQKSQEFSSYLSYIEDCITVIQNWRSHPENTKEIWSTFKNEYDPIIANLMKLATNEALPKLDKITKEWLSLHNIDLKRAKIIIASTHGPRSRLAEAQYMEALVKSTLKISDSKGIDNVYIYQTEVLPSQLSDGEQLEKQLLHELLDPSLVNSMIGSKMLNDPLAMYQDILHRDAQDWIETDSKLQGDKSRCPMHVTPRF